MEHFRTKSDLGSSVGPSSFDLGAIFGLIIGSLAIEKSKIYGVHSRTVGLHYDLNPDPGHTQVRF
jgi:hypothetical protein